MIEESHNEPAPANPSAEPRRRWLPSRGRAVIVFFVALVLLLLNDAFFVESIIVPSGSMEPTIMPNERIWMVHRHGTQYQRFDVVVINLGPSDKRIVKRIIGLPGDHVEIDEGFRVKINGVPFDYSPGPHEQTRIEAADHVIQISRPSSPTTQPATSPAIFACRLGQGEYFVMGDNRFGSRDSREIGAIRAEQIEGTAELTWYSFDLVAHRMRWERMFHRLR